MAKKRYITIAIIVVVSLFLAYLQFVQCRCNTDDAGTYAYMYNYFELGNKELGLKTFLNPWFFCSAIAYLLNIGGSGTFSSLAYISFWYGIAVFLTLLLIMHNKDSRWLLAFAAFILLPYRTTNKYHMVVAFVTLFAIWALQLYEDNRKKWILFLVGFVSIYTLLFTDDRLLLVLFLFVPLSVYLIILLFQDYDKRKYLYVAFWGVALVAGILKIIDMITIKISGQGLGIMEAMGGYGGVDYYNWIDVENFFSKGIPSLFSSLLIQWNVPIEGGMIQFKSFYWIIRIIIAGLALAALISRWIEILKKGLKSIALLDSLSVICTTVVLAFNMCNGMIKYYNIKGAPMNRYASVCWFLLVVILARWLDERYGATMIFHNISNNSFLGVVFILLSIGYVNPVFVPSEDIINSGFAFEIDFLKEHGDTYKYGLGSHWKSVPVTAATNAEYVVCKALIEDDKFVCGKSDGFYRDGGNYFNFIVSDGNNDMTISHENINKIRGNYIEAYSDEDTIYVYDYDVRFDTTVVMDTAGMGYELTDTITYYLDLPVGSSRIELTTAAKDNLLLNVLENDEIANVRIDNKGDDIATIEITCLQNTQIGLSVGRREDIPTILYKIEIKRTAGAVFVDKEQTKLPLNEGRYIVTFSGEDLKDMKINWKIDGEVTQLTNGRIKRRYLIDISRKQDIEYEIVTNGALVETIYYENENLFDE